MLDHEVVVVGAGTAGCVAARCLVEAGKRVLLIEAGPDYGPRNSGRWPTGLLSPNVIPTSHDAGYMTTGPAGQQLAQPRARVIGGCSSHNHCGIVWGSRASWNAWAELTGGAWSADRATPYLHRAASQMRARPVDDDALRPLGRAFLEAASETRGLPVVADADYCVPSAGRFLFNIDSGERFNAAFAYLDEVRGSEALTVVANAVVERFEVANGRFSQLIYRSNGHEHAVGGAEVLLCAGAYDTPALLMRSGIGSPEVLGEAGIVPVHSAPSVGSTLFNHPAIALVFESSERLETLNRAFQSPEWMPTWQTFVKDRSSRCERTLDVHLYPSEVEADGVNRVVVGVACMTPQSVGEVRIDRDGRPVIDHRYLSAEHDIEVLVEGVEIARAIFDSPHLADLVGAELAPGPTTDASLREWITLNVEDYFHPAGTCRMGVDETITVLDPTGAVHGLDGVHVADASVMPALPDANTNLPVAAIAESLATSRD